MTREKKAREIYLKKLISLDARKNAIGIEENEAWLEYINSISSSSDPPKPFRERVKDFFFIYSNFDYNNCVKWD